MIIIKSFFNISNIHLQNFHYIDQANKNQPWSITDIIITMLFVLNFLDYGQESKKNRVGRMAK